MCLTVAEAAPKTEHRRRHHRRQADLAIRPKDGPNKDYKTATDTIFRRIKNNIRFYRDDLKYYLGFREVRGAKGNPKWLPKINFVAIHFHSFSNLRSRVSCLSFYFIFNAKFIPVMFVISTSEVQKYVFPYSR